MSFITNPQELERFNNPRYIVERNIIARNLEDEIPGDNFPDEYETRLKTVVNREIASLVDSSGNFKLRCLFIECAEDDGMTWAAQTLYHSIPKNFTQFKAFVKGLKGYEHLQTPLLAGILGPKKFYQALDKTSMVTWRSRERYIQWLVTIGTLGKIIVDIMINLSSSNGNKVTDVIFHNPLNIALIGVAVFLAFLLNKLASGFNSDSLKEKYYRELTEHGAVNSEIYQQAVAAVTGAMTLTEPRLLIIDNYNNLDKTTRLALEQYLLNYRNHDTFEFWVVFYHRNGLNSPTNFLARNQAAAVNSCIQTYFLAPVTSLQKKKLAANLELPAYAQEFNKIKMICGNGESDYSGIQQFLKTYRNTYPVEKRGYDDLEVLYLLALNASPGRIFLEQKAYVDLLKSEKFVLTEFMGGKSVDIRFLPELIDRIFRTFKQFTQIEISNGVKRYALITELKDAFLQERFYRSLDLPDHHLGHLFWTFYWENRMKNIRDSGWYHKLSHHLLAADGIANFSRNRGDLRNRLITSVLPSTIDGCLMSGLFDVVPALLQEAWIFWGEQEDEQLEKLVRQQQLVNLVNKCWKAYLLTGNDALLDLLAEIAGREDFLSGELINDFPGDRRADELFPWKGRAKAWPLAVKGHTASETDQEDLAKLLDSKVLGVLTKFRPQALLCRAVAHSDSDYVFTPNYVESFSWILAQIYQLTGQRSWQQPDELKLLTLSEAVFSLGLQIYYYGHIFAADDPDRLDHFGHDKFEALVTALNSFSAIVLQTAQRAERGNMSQEAVYFKQTYIFEFYLNALSAIKIAFQQCYTRDPATTSGNRVIGELNTFLRAANQALSFQFPELRSPRELLHSKGFVDELKKLFKLCIITARSLGAERLYAELNYRSCMFNVIFKKIDFEKLIKATSSVRQQSSLTGVLANLLVSNTQADSRELRTAYLLDGINLADRAGFNQQLVYELLLVFICDGGELNIDLIDLSGIVRRSGLTTGWLNYTLEHIDDEGIDSMILRIYNFMHFVHDDTLQAEVTAIVAQRAAAITVEAVAKKVNKFLEYQELRAQLKSKQPVDLEQTLASWRDTGYWLYHADVLHRLMDAGYQSVPLQQDALALLAANRYNYADNSVLFLAVECVKNIRVIEQNTLSELTGYIKDAMETWESSLGSVTNIMIYELLTRQEIQEPRWPENVRKWQKYRSQISDMQLMYLMHNRQYFDYVKYCYKILRSFGLLTDSSDQEISNRLALTEAEISVAVTRWKDTGGGVPNLFSEQENGVVLCSDYLVLGSYLFEHNQFNTSQYNGYRDTFHHVAFRDLPVLYELISSLRSLPANFHDIFLRHNARFELGLME